MRIRRIKKTKKRDTGRSPRTVKMGRSLPTTSYYSRDDSMPSLSHNSHQTRKKRELTRGRTKEAAAATEALDKISATAVARRSKIVLRRSIHFVGIIALAGVLLYNTGLHATGIKVLDSPLSIENSSNAAGVSSKEGSGSSALLSSSGAQAGLKSDDLLFRSDEEYQAVVDEVFNRSYSHRTKLLFRSGPFEQEVADMLPEIENVTAVVPLVGTRLQVGLSLADVGFRMRTLGDQIGLVSSEGVLLRVGATKDIAGNFIDRPFLAVDPQISFTEGAQVLTSNEAEMVNLLVSEFDGSTRDRPRIKSLTYRIETRALDVSFLGVPYGAKLTTESESSARGQVGSLVATIASLAEQGIEPKEYVDVRVDERVFVK